MAEPVIDAHFHWFPPSYPRRLCEREGFPRAEPLADGGYRFIYNDGRVSTDQVGVYFDLDRTLQEAQRATGPDTTVIITSGAQAGVVDQMPVEEAVDVALEFNEELAKTARDHAGTVYGAAYVPLNDTARAIEVTDHAINELGLVGINLPALTSDGFTDSPRLEPFYDHVEKLGVPLIVHPTDMVYREVFPEYDTAIYLGLGRLIDSSLNVLRLVFSGIMERHPDLKVLLNHAGGVLPYQAGRIDKNVRILGTLNENAHVKNLSELPSTYLRRIYVDTVVPQPLTIRTALEFFPSSHVLYGTDHPFCWDAQEAIGIFEKAGVDPATRQLVLEANAQKLFRLPAQAERMELSRASGSPAAVGAT